MLYLLWLQHVRFWRVCHRILGMHLSESLHRCFNLGGVGCGIRRTEVMKQCLYKDNHILIAHRRSLQNYSSTKSRMRLPLTMFLTIAFTFPNGRRHLPGEQATFLSAASASV